MTSADLFVYRPLMLWVKTSAASFLYSFEYNAAKKFLFRYF